MKLAKVLILILYIYLFTTYLSGFVGGNESANAFNEGSSTNMTECSQRENSSDIGRLIVYGKVYNMSSYSHTLKLLRNIELAEKGSLDLYDSVNHLNAAILELENASNTYFQLVVTLSFTPYNDDVIQKLKNFDYDALLQSNNLNKDVFSKVQNYLSKGDVIGAYYKLYNDVNNILYRLYLNGWSIYLGIKPEVRDLWRINQEYMESIRFGQYVSEVFNSL